MSHPRRSRISGPRARSRFRLRRRTSEVSGLPLALSTRRGQVWTSVVRINADARAEGHRARMMREADEHAKALALAVADEEICACRLASASGLQAFDHVTAFDLESASGLVEMAHKVDYLGAVHEVNRLRATAPKVPPPRAGAERFEAPLVRDKATARAVGNKYANAPAGTRAAHKRTPPPTDSAARAERCARREEVQRWRRLARHRGLAEPTANMLRGLVGVWR